MLRKFFYLCAGILCLVLAWHLGARSASAVGVPPQGAAFAYNNGSRSVSFASGRIVYGYETSQFGTDFTPLAPSSQPVPGSDDIVATLQYPGGDGNNYLAMTANGDVYETTEGGAWQFRGNFPSGTPARTETWGAVKARYR